MSKPGDLFRSRPARLLAALSLLANLAAGAEPSEPQQRRAEAQAHFERGLELANAKRDWAGALDEFLLSRRLLPRRSATRNAAIALRELGRYAEALEMYQTLFAEFGSEMPAEQLVAARADEAKVRERVGEVELHDGEPGTAVTVDGKSLGVTPLGRPIWLDRGTHTLRLSKEGFEPVEQQLRVLPGTTNVVSARLKPLQNSGVLSIREARGESLEVVVDAVVVGRTPWRGSVAVGRHAVLLRDKGRGTQPVPAQVKLREVTELTLEATPLDSEALVEPRPETATVFVNGVFVGSGVWQGQLPSGLHRFEALAPGYVPFRQEARLEPGRRVTVRAKLAPDAPAPSSPLIGLFVEGAAGPLLARSLGGALTADCDCREYSHPFGWQVQARVGYALKARLAVELGGGWLTLAQNATRNVVALADRDVPFASNDYRDTAKLSGPFGIASGSLRFGERFPVTARVGAGLSRLTLESSNVATYVGTVVLRDGTSSELSGELSAPESASRLWVPLLSTELRGGYRISRRWSVELGAALMVLATPRSVRHEAWPTFPNVDGNPAAKAAGYLRSPDAVLTSAFLATNASMSVRFEL